MKKADGFRSHLCEPAIVYGGADSGAPRLPAGDPSQNVPCFA